MHTGQHQHVRLPLALPGGVGGAWLRFHIPAQHCLASVMLRREANGCCAAGHGARNAAAPPPEVATSTLEQRRTTGASEGAVLAGGGEVLQSVKEYYGEVRWRLAV